MPTSSKSVVFVVKYAPSASEVDENVIGRRRWPVPAVARAGGGRCRPVPAAGWPRRLAGLAPG
ncbi:MAG: hypothetical protein M0005_07620 [Actinomycetota bacterium]|nr:hypothetical protein [Actinomycetota bacterium]